MFIERKPVLDLPSCQPLSTAHNLASVQNFILTKASNTRSNQLIHGKSASKNTNNKILVDSSSFNGYFSFYEITENIYLAVTNVQFLKRQVFNFVGENGVRFHFRISGCNSIVMKDLVQYDMSGSFAEVCIHPQGIDRFEFFYPETERHLWATIFCTAESLEDNLGIQLENLPSTAEKVIHTHSPQYYSEKTALSGAMRSAVHNLATASFTENVLDIYRKAKVAELVCLIVDALKRESGKTIPKIRIRRRDVERLHEVRKLLIQDTSLALNIGQLVRETGLNRNKLTYGFKEMFGMTMSDFCRQHRFKQANELLTSTDINISEIAYISGYSNVANFSNAYKKYYGFSPKQSRLDNAKKGRKN